MWIPENPGEILGSPDLRFYTSEKLARQLLHFLVGKSSSISVFFVTITHCLMHHAPTHEDSYHLARWPIDWARIYIEFHEWISDRMRKEKTTTLAVTRWPHNIKKHRKLSHGRCLYNVTGIPTVHALITPQSFKSYLRRNNHIKNCTRKSGNRKLEGTACA